MEHAIIKAYETTHSDHTRTDIAGCLWGSDLTKSNIHNIFYQWITEIKQKSIFFLCWPNTSLEISWSDAVKSRFRIHDPSMSLFYDKTHPCPLFSWRNRSQQKYHRDLPPRSPIGSIDETKKLKNISEWFHCNKKVTFITILQLK